MVLPGLICWVCLTERNLHLNPANITIRPVLSMLPGRLRIYLSRMAVVFQIGWGRISHPGMPFNGMMLFPTELSLRTTKDGIRLFSKPIDELDRLQTSVGKWRR